MSGAEFFTDEDSPPRPVGIPGRLVSPRKAAFRYLTNKGCDRPYFGSIPDFGVESPGGYAISGVTKGGPAEVGGLKAGDIIIKFGDTKIAGLDDFDGALRQHRAGDKVPVRVKRDGKEVPLEVTLEPPR
jgi:S1-C subfamily serine protease